MSEVIDPILYPILEQATSLKDGAFVSLGGKMIEWNNSCRLFLCTKLSNPSYAPKIIEKVTFINFCISREGSQINFLNVLEDSLLRELSFGTGAILDNEDLITTLEKKKLNAVDIKNKIDGSSIAKAHFEEARSACKSGAM